MEWLSGILFQDNIILKFLKYPGATMTAHPRPTHLIMASILDAFTSVITHREDTGYRVAVQLGKATQVVKWRSLCRMIATLTGTHTDLDLRFTSYRWDEITSCWPQDVCNTQQYLGTTR